jgi:hypothetical protein
VLGELRAAAALALVEGVEQVAAAALLAEALPLAGAVELWHLYVHLRVASITCDQGLYAWRHPVVHLHNK